MRHTLLVAGEPGEARDRMVETLRTHDFFVVVAEPPGAFQALHSPEYQFNGVLLLCRPGQHEELSLVAQIRAGKLPLRILVGLLGCNQDEIETHLLDRVDAMLPQDLPVPQLISRIRAVFDRS